MAAIRLLLGIVCLAVTYSTRLPERNLLKYTRFSLQDQRRSNLARLAENEIGNNKPRSGWSPDLFPNARLARSTLPGNVIGIYFPDKHRIAHVGLIVHEKDNWITSIEGNTNIIGGREGDGVYRKLRHRRTIYKISDWLTESRTAKR